MKPIEFIQHNIGTVPYELARFAIIDYHPKLILDENKVQKGLIERAKKDLKLFEIIEVKRLENIYPIVGDAIIRKDGRKTYIGIFTYDGNFQDTEGGSFCIYESGASYSGGFTMDVLNIKNLKLTTKKTSLYCWIFSENLSGGNRGVYKTIKVKTWKEI